MNCRCPDDAPARPAVAGVLFDLDGTLLDTHDLILENFRHATRAVLGRALPDGVLMAKVGIPLVEQAADFSDDPAVRAAIVEAYRAHNDRVHDALVREFPGMRALLEGLAARGVPLGVVTSKKRAVAERGLALFGYDRLLPFVIGSDDAPRHKPDPAPVLAGCVRLGLDPSACAYVGDSPFDLMAGNAAGCVSVAVTWGMFSEPTLAAERPARIVHAPEDLPAALSLA